MQKSENKKLPKNVFILGLVSFFTDFSTEMIYPLLPIFLYSVLGASKSFIGLLEGIAETTASILKVFSGWFSDKIKKRKVFILFGYSISAISKPLIGFSKIPLHVLVLRFFDRVGKGIRTAPRDALVADSTPEEIRGKSFGYHRAMDTAGAVVGPLVAFLLLPLLRGNYRTLFAFTFIPGLIAVTLILLFIKEQKRNTEILKIEASWKKEVPPKFFIFLAAIVLFTLGNSSDAFLILRANLAGISSYTIPILWLFFNLVYAILATPFGILSDKIGRKKMVTAGFVVYSIVYAGFAFAVKKWQIWGLFLVYGLYYAMVEGGLRAFVADIVGKEKRATAYGIYHTAVGVAAFPASFIFGILWQYFGFQIAFLTGSGLSLLALVLLQFV